MSLSSHTKLDDHQKERSLSLSTMLYEDKVREREGGREEVLGKG